MKRIIVDYKKLTEEILNLLIEKYPDGYNDSDIIVFKNASGETVEAVEVRTEDTIYLVKVSVKLEERMESYIDDEDDEDDDLMSDEKDISFDKNSGEEGIDVDDEDDMDDYDDDPIDDDTDEDED